MYADRALRVDDIPWLIDIHRAPHATPFIHAPSDTRLRKLVDDGTMHARVVIDGNGMPAGFFAVSLFDGWLAEIHGIVSARPRSGAGRWALREAMRWAFDEAGAHRLWLEVVAANAPARALYEAEGLTHEGTFRDGYTSAPGVYEDLAHYGILKDEWRKTH